MKPMNLTQAAKALNIERVVLSGILVGMGITPQRAARRRGGVQSCWLTPAQVRLIRQHLEAYRSVAAAGKGGA